MNSDMQFDRHKNLAQALIAVVPEDRANGTEFSVYPGQGSLLAANMPVTMHPPDEPPTYDNSEIGYISAIDGDSLTVLRAQEGSLAREVDQGWFITGSVTERTLTMIEDELASKASTDDLATVALTGNKADIGLSSVDNTSDANKPISTATQAALDAKLDDSQKGAVNGLAELDGLGKIPITQLPSYVDNAVETYADTQDAKIRPSAPVKRPTIKPITTFAAGHGFTRTSAAGTQVDVTNDSYMGSQSMMLTTAGDSSPVVSKKSTFSPVVNLTGKLPVVAVKLTNFEHITELIFYFSSDNVTSSWYTVRPTDDVSMLKNNAWIPLSLSFGKATATGSPNRASINSVQVRVKDDGTAPVSVKFGLIGYTDEPSSAVCTLTFDDGTSSQYDLARKKMDSYGMAGTLYAIPSHVGNAGSLTIDQMREMQDRSGWDIAAHTYTHPHLSDSLTPEEVEEEFVLTKDWLVDNGFSGGANHLAYPYGNYDYDKVIPLAKKYFSTARAVVTYPESTKIINPYVLRGYYVTNTSTLAAMQAIVTRAIANNEWAIFTFHKIVTTPTVPEEFPTATFNAFIDWLATQPIPVKPLSEVVGAN